MQQTGVRLLLTIMYRDVAKKTAKGFFISQARFFMQQNLKITSCLCFPEQFELVVSSFSASEIDQQPAMTFLLSVSLQNGRSQIMTSKVWIRQV